MLAALLATIVVGCLAILVSSAPVPSPAAVTALVELPSITPTDPIYHTWAAASVIMALQLVTLLVVVFRTRTKRTVVTKM